MADNHAGHDHEVPTHTWKPPTRKAFLTTLSAAAFVSGLGIATVMSIRRGRRIRLEETKELAKSTNTVARMGGSSSAKESTSDENALSASRGALSLFTEMNRAVFARRFRQESTDEVAQVPMILQRKEPKRSLFDTETQRPPPSALLKAGNTAQVAEQSSSRVHSAPHPGHRLSTPRNRAEGSLSSVERSEGSLSVDEKTSSEEEYSFFDSPIFVALRALVTATFFVGIGAWVGIEIVYRWLQVKNVDELVERLPSIIPSNERGVRALKTVGAAARSSLGGEMAEEVEEDEQDASANPPLPVSEAMKRLDMAAERGDVDAWVQILRRQLDAERRRDVEKRRGVHN